MLIADLFRSTKTGIVLFVVAMVISILSIIISIISYRVQTRLAKQERGSRLEPQNEGKEGKE